MSEAAVSIEGIGKRYRLGERVPYRALRDEIAKFAALPFRRGRHGRQRDGFIWALKDISLEIKPGEVVGFIGRNGAGKTTLLKILSRITEPTEGSAEIRGRVGSLLEVGTGFHAELTGRENIYLSGAILGMKRAEIRSKFDEMVAFAEVEKFIDTPVKRYSSGMFVRLAFAVAAHLEPEVLLVDEVLSVGDVKFQRKCLGKMKGVASEGRTVLFVSHNMGTISTLCERTVLLNDGRIEYTGPTRETVSRYLAGLTADAGMAKSWSFEEAPGGRNVKLKSVTITDSTGAARTHFSTTAAVYVWVEYWVLGDGVPINPGLWLFDEQNNWICAVGNYEETAKQQISAKGVYRSRCIIPGHLLNSGRHTLTVEMAANLSDAEACVQHCVGFETVDDQRIHSRYSRWSGIIKPRFDWKTEKTG